jgi:hypothetical protein
MDGAGKTRSSREREHTHSLSQRTEREEHRQTVRVIQSGVDSPKVIDRFVTQIQFFFFLLSRGGGRRALLFIFVVSLGFLVTLGFVLLGGTVVSGRIRSRLALDLCGAFFGIRHFAIFSEKNNKDNQSKDWNEQI